MKMNAKEFFKGLLDTIFSRDCLHGFIGLVIPAMCINNVLKQSPHSAVLIIITIIIIITSILVGIICDLHRYRPRTRKSRLYVCVVNTMSHILMISMLVATLKAFESNDYSLFIVTITFSLLTWGLNEDYQDKMKETR